jgi:hypothetical protein
LLATAPAGTAFRGVAFAPSVVPEPGSLLLAGRLASASLRRYRGRRVNLATQAGNHPAVLVAEKKIGKSLCIPYSFPILTRLHPLRDKESDTPPSATTNSARGSPRAERRG